MAALGLRPEGIEGLLGETGRTAPLPLLLLLLLRFTAGAGSASTDGSACSSGAPEADDDEGASGRLWRGRGFEGARSDAKDDGDAPGFDACAVDEPDATDAAGARFAEAEPEDELEDEDEAERDAELEDEEEDLDLEADADASPAPPAALVKSSMSPSSRSVVETCGKNS